MVYLFVNGEISTCSPILRLCCIHHNKIRGRDRTETYKRQKMLCSLGKRSLKRKIFYTLFELLGAHSHLQKFSGDIVLVLYFHTLRDFLCLVLVLMMMAQCKERS